MAHRRGPRLINSGVAESMLALDYPVVSSIESPPPIPVATTLEYVEQFLPARPEGRLR